MAKRMLVLVTVLAAMLVVAAPAMAREAQYAPGDASEAQYVPEEVSLEEAIAAEEFAGFGVVEAVGEKWDGTPVYGLSVSADEGYYLEGGFDFAAFEGQNVYVTGEIVFHRGGGSFLRVERIEPSDDGYATEERTTGSETAVKGAPPAEAGPEEITAAPVSFGGEEEGGGVEAPSLLPDSGGALVLILGLGALLTVGGGMIHRAVR